MVRASRYNLYPQSSEPSTPVLQNASLSEDATQQILAWTNGQPELTQRLLQLVLDQEGAYTSEAAASVNQVVQRHFQPDLLSSEDPKDQPVVRLLQRIAEGLTQEPSGSLLKQYHEILIATKRKPYSNLTEQNRLLKLGLIALDGDRTLGVANPLFKKFFNQDWTERQLEGKLTQKRLDKYHLALGTGLISLLLFALFQGYTRYVPYARLIQCNGNPVFRAAIDANASLDEKAIQSAITELKALQNQQSLSAACAPILYDLQYSQAIYLEAGIRSNPMTAVQVLCEIPKEYYTDRDTQPWFTRWSSLYRNTPFPSQLKDYIQNHPCPAANFLSR